MDIRLADPHRTADWAHMRYPVVGREAMVACSQPLASQAALEVMRNGGNAVDAVLTAAAMLCVLEPMWTGIGGDCFAVVWDGTRAIGLDAAGPAPECATTTEPVQLRGPRSVTVPGAVAGWAELSSRFGKLSLGECLERAIEIAEKGYPVSPIVAWHWKVHQAPDQFTPIPGSGDVFPMPALARCLRAIARDGASAFYQGPIAASIAKSCWVTEQDLGAFKPRWVELQRATYKGVSVLEMPAPTQGIAVLEALKLFEGGDATLENQIRAMQLALEDARAHVRDNTDVSHLIDADFIANRRKASATLVSEPGGGTVYICAVDRSGMAVSFIQSLYMPFGSNVVAGDTGILLQNRGAGFLVSGRYAPGQRPYHTIIPGMALKDGRLYGVFGVVGGFVQAQAHFQFITNIVDERRDPQEALDRPRFFIDKDVVRLERGLWHQTDALRSRGLNVAEHTQRFDFGGGQAIFKIGETLVGGSDSRKDGVACGF